MQSTPDDIWQFVYKINQLKLLSFACFQVELSWCFPVMDPATNESNCYLALHNSVLDYTLIYILTWILIIVLFYYSSAVQLFKVRDKDAYM